MTELLYCVGVAAVCVGGLAAFMGLGIFVIWVCAALRVGRMVE